MTDLTLAERLATHPRSVIVNVWAPWCAPCRRMAPIVERLAGEYDGHIDVWKVNADEQPDEVRRLRVLGIPTMVAFRGGQEVTRKVGARSEADLCLLFETALSGQAPAHRGIALSDRVLRLAAGTALVLLGLTSGPSLLLLTVGGVVLFTAIADRCPVWQAVRVRLEAWVKRRGSASLEV